jgi:hypothetical protein
VELHYAALAVLFTPRRKQKRAKVLQGAPTPIDPGNYPKSLAGYLFQSYYALMASVTPTWLYHRHRSEYSDLLISLYNTLARCDPLAPQGVSVPQTATDPDYPDERGDSNSVLSWERAFWQYWYPWFADRTHTSRDDFLWTVKLLAKASGAFAYIVTLTYHVAPWRYDDARRRAEQQLRRVYGPEARLDSFVRYLEAQQPITPAPFDS